jgi:2,4-dienoyl-CoA reductase-like NADH-dependent reductase (Old Yellow Enzyme family)
MQAADKVLLQEYALNSALTLKNRIVMAPMTRAKTKEDGVPIPEMVDYYGRRADAGLIVTEGTIIRPDGRGHDGVPGVYSPAQIAKWQAVTDRVHEQGGLIFCQIWHVGRASHPSFIGGEKPLGPSKTVMSGRIWRHEGLFFGESRAATEQEIQNLISDFAEAAFKARRAGFDGVEIHGANGYLIDQFLHYNTNHREDAYGGTPENMSRFARDVVDACGKAIGYERVGLRLSPMGYLNEIVQDERDPAVFQFLLKALNPLRLAYVHTGNFNDTEKFNDLGNRTMTQFLRQDYTGTLIGCGSYTVDQAEEAIANKEFDLLALGRLFIANPDLIARLKSGKGLTLYDASMLHALI